MKKQIELQKKLQKLTIHANDKEQTELHYKLAVIISKYQGK